MNFSVALLASFALVDALVGAACKGIQQSAGCSRHEENRLALHAYSSDFLYPCGQWTNSCRTWSKQWSSRRRAQQNDEYLFISPLLLLLLLSESLLCPLPLHGSITSFSSVCKYHLTVQLVHGIQPGPVFVVPHKVGVVAILEFIVRFALLPHVDLPDGQRTSISHAVVLREGAL